MDVAVGNDIDFVYLLWPGKYVNSQPLYKLGRSLDIIDLYNCYGSNSIIISFKMISDVTEVIRQLNYAFTRNYGDGIIDEGEGMFTGNAQAMYVLFEKMTSPYIHAPLFAPLPPPTPDPITLAVPTKPLPPIPAPTTPLIEMPKPIAITEVKDTNTAYLLSIAVKNSEGRFICPKCGNTLASKWALKGHLNQSRDCRIIKQFREDLKDTNCRWCGKTFKNGHLKNTHMLKVCKNKPADTNDIGVFAIRN